MIRSTYIRPLIVLGILLGWGLQSSFTPPPRKDKILRNARRYLPNSQQQALLVRKLEEQEASFDVDQQLLRRYVPPTANHYHSNLIDTTVHSLRESAHYAADLMDSGLPNYQWRALQIFQKLASLQDQDPEHDTYGIWPYHQEETLAEMNRPDWNWADFIGVQFLETFMKHYAAIPDNVRLTMREAIIHASRSIQRRDVKPGYTNIAIMGTLVTYLSAHLFDLSEMKEYADRRLLRFYEYTRELRGFAEYNSPTYTRVALDELCRMRQYILHKDAREMIDYCYDTGWEILASHFHSPTGQLAAPHSRSYSTLSRDQFYDFLYGASQGRIAYGEATYPANYYKLRHKIPSRYRPYFISLPEARTEVDTFSLDENPVVGTTYLHPRYCVGTANRSTTWQQRRPLVAYWGTAEAPRYLQPRLLHDFVDFGIGNIFSRQQNNRVLTALNFARNGGDYHISIDRLTDGTFRAKDIRLRFEFGGSDRYDQMTITDDQTIRVVDGDTRIEVQLLHACFADEQIYRLEKGKDEERSWVDLLIYSGDERVFDLTTMEQAAIGWTTRISTNRDQSEDSVAARAEVQNQQLQLEWGDLRLSVPVRPADEAVLQRSFSLE